MKNLKKFLALILLSMMLSSVLSGCSDTNKVVMGTNAAFPPFEYTTTDGLVGEFDGIDVAIAVKIAEKLGKELQIEDMEFEGLIAAVSTGKVDMVLAGMTATDERRQSVDFSDPYFTASQVILVSSDNTDILSAEDLKNDKTVGVVLGYTGDDIVTNTIGVSEDKITRANRSIDMIQDVKNGKLDAAVLDSATGYDLSEKNGLKVIEDPEVFESEEYAIAVKKGNTELLNTINEVIREMKESGELTELAEKYN